MKKLLGIVVLGLSWFNFFIITNSYSHPTNKFSFIICKTSYASTIHHIEIDLRKKTIDDWNSSNKTSNIYNIYDITETWIKAKKTENNRIIVHRYLDYMKIQSKIEDEWKEDHDGSGNCETIKRKF